MRPYYRDMGEPPFVRYSLVSPSQDEYLSGPLQRFAGKRPTGAYDVRQHDIVCLTMLTIRDSRLLSHH